MGQVIVRFLCGSGRNRVVPFSTDARVPVCSPRGKSSAPGVVSDFCEPLQPQETNWPPCKISSLAGSAISDLSHGTSMATISLGSEQTISTTSMENLIKQCQSITTLESGREDMERSSSHFRRPGLWTPEPPEIPLSNSQFDFLPGELPGKENALAQPLEFGNEMAQRKTSVASFNRFVTIEQTSPLRLQSKNAVQSSANVSISSSRHTRASTPIPRGPILIKVQPCRGQDTTEQQKSEPALQACKHGVVLKGDDDADTHEVRCVKCERPQSKGGRMLQQLMENRKKEKMLKRERNAEKKRLMEEERERRRQAKEAIDNALQKFVDLQRQKEETK